MTTFSIILTVKSEVLSEGLSANCFEASAHKISETLSVVIEISRSEALICAVKERKQFFLLNHVSDRFPLFFGRVNAGRVVCTRVQDHHRVRRSGTQVFDEAIEV